MTSKPEHNKFSMSCISCHQIGTDMGAHGWTEEQVSRWLELGGWNPKGRTARRIFKAYRRQLAAG